MKSRRYVRERVLQALYAFEIGGSSSADVLEQLIRPVFRGDLTAWTFARTLFLQTIAIKEEADAIVRNHSVNWDPARMAFLDRLILRMALCEFLCFEEIPPKVTINEAIDIGKRYSTDNSGNFINGILDAALRDLMQSGKIKKSGRGRIGMTW